MGKAGGAMAISLLNGKSDPKRISVTPVRFQEAYDRFQQLIAANSQGHAFTNFREGIAAAWEGYKPRLRDHALRILAPETWAEDQIGSGTILNHTIAAIEIQDHRANLTNNLVFWQNRFGHANRDHRALLDGAGNPRQQMEIERLLFGLYRGDADDADTFEGLAQLKGSTYPLLAYLLFLKDMDRFMPIRPSTSTRPSKRSVSTSSRCANAPGTTIGASTLRLVECKKPYLR